MEIYIASMIVIGFINMVFAIFNFAGIIFILKDHHVEITKDKSKDVKLDYEEKCDYF